MGLCEPCGKEKTTATCPYCGFEVCITCAKRTCQLCNRSMTGKPTDADKKRLKDSHRF